MNHGTVHCEVFPFTRTKRDEVARSADVVALFACTSLSTCIYVSVLFTYMLSGTAPALRDYKEHHFHTVWELHGAHQCFE